MYIKTEKPNGNTLARKLLKYRVYKYVYRNRWSVQKETGPFKKIFIDLDVKY